jgi:hypothetical protein
MKNVENPNIKYVADVVHSYKESLISIVTAFEANKLILDIYTKEARIKYDAFAKPFIYEENDVKRVRVPAKEVPNYNRLRKRYDRTIIAQTIVPQSLLISLVSQFDNLVAGLVRSVYQVKPEKINASESVIKYSELKNFTSIENVIDKFIDDKIESILRESHDDQFTELEKLFDVKTLKAMDCWADFIEITQRRNLLVHCDGKVSQQYIKKCSDAGCKCLDKKGEKLDVDEDYFNKAFGVLYSVGVKLSQVMLRKFHTSEEVTQIDTILNDIIYELISEGKYYIAIDLSEFATKEATHANQNDKLFFVLNKAQAYKWTKQHEKCKETLDKEDWSTTNDDFKLPYYVLNDDFDKAITSMKKLHQYGESEIYSQNSYKEWPIFSEIRKNAKFKEAFKEIFNEDIDTKELIEEKETIPISA